ncbi:cupredoxin domain-containing protein [Bordetella genomosp. 5]|uniref:Blue (type 1) copper domain-containing protein n=1 Tax=Bordetella genomosp. 5 TaxID=1395608 RepID=A0A261U3J2_9BORD|nr:cupredoxin family protein [Bordetella genomosp. 5]OZI55433.1 hypothetical protein CAL25_03285 [Bordetella genomosp. 5]
MPSLLHSLRLPLAALLLATTALPLHAAPGAPHTHGAAHDRAHDPEHPAPAEDGTGVPGQAGAVTRTIEVDMGDDMRFTPAAFDVRAGETVRIALRNRGMLRHELVLGNAQTLAAHYDAMLARPGMTHEHTANALSLDGGETGELLWRFTDAGTVSFACLEPGHYPAGMRGEVRVR